MAKRYLGLDLGEKRIGVALSDEAAITAQPLKTIQRVGIKKDMGQIAALVTEHDVQAVVLGLPLNMDGSQGAMAENVHEFSRRLQGRILIPIHLWDERLSTVAAERSMLEADLSRKKRKENIDQIAAALILQSWLDAQT